MSSHHSNGSSVSGLTLAHFRRRFKILLSFYQVWAVRQSVYGFALPPHFSSWMSFLEALSFDVGDFLFPSWTCIGGLTARITFNGLWPLLVMMMVVLVRLALQKGRKGSFQTAQLYSLEAFIFISYCVLPSVTRSVCGAARLSEPVQIDHAHL